MNKHLKILILLLFLCLLFYLIFKDFSTNIRVQQAGGAYAVSPDKQWKAEIWDSFCEDNGKFYAAIYLWDCKKYPSLLKEEIHSNAGKKPEVKLVFPKDFHARDAKCDVKWMNANVFEIEFDSANGLQIFRYDIPNQAFFLKNVNDISNM